MIKKIKYVKHNKGYKLQQHGNWIDLASAENVYMNPFTFRLIDLGISMELPKGYEANIVPRSSTFKKFGIISANSFGVVDTEYCGMLDRWGFPAISQGKSVDIKKNDRICQFRISLSIDASICTKIKYLFTRFEFIEVDMLYSKSRGGFGSTGK